MLCTNPYLADVELQFPDVSLHRADLLFRRAERKRDVRNYFPNESLGNTADRKSPIFSIYNIAPHPQQPYLVQVVVKGLKEKWHRLRRRAAGLAPLLRLSQELQDSPGAS